MNSDLYGKKVEVPETVLNYLEQCNTAAKGASETTEGYKRNQELREKREVSYQQLKRMKNWFDNFDGKDNDLSFILNGGHYVKNWVNETLKSMRDGVSNMDKHRQEVIPDDLNNTKDMNLGNMNRPSKSHTDTINKYNREITENLKRINELMKKLI